MNTEYPTDEFGELKVPRNIDPLSVPLPFCEETGFSQSWHWDICGLPPRFVHAQMEPDEREFVGFAQLYFSKDGTFQFRGRGNHPGPETHTGRWIRCFRRIRGDSDWTAGWHVFPTIEAARAKIWNYWTDEYIHRLNPQIVEVRVRGLRLIITQPVMGQPVLICDEIFVPVAAVRKAEKIKRNCDYAAPFPQRTLVNTDH